MIEDNRRLLLSSFEALDPRGDLTQPRIPKDRRTDGENAEDALSLGRIFDRFPDYSRRFSLIVAQVRHMNKFTTGPTWADWVVQLGSHESEGTLIYARFAAEKDWQPSEDCAVALVEGVPIAYGKTSEPGGLRTYQVVYLLASGVTCVPTGEGATQPTPPVG